MEKLVLRRGAVIELDSVSSAVRREKDFEYVFVSLLGSTVLDFEIVKVLDSEIVFDRPCRVSEADKETSFVVVFVLLRGC